MGQFQLSVTKQKPIYNSTITEVNLIEPFDQNQGRYEPLQRGDELLAKVVNIRLCPLTPQICNVANSEIFGGKNSHGYLSRDLEATMMITRVAA